MSTPPSTVVSERSLEALELPALLAVVGRLAATTAGRRRVRALRPMASPDRLETRRRRYEEVRLLLGDGALVPALEADWEELFDRLREAEERVAGADLLQIADLLAAAGRARRRIEVPEAVETAALAAGLPDAEPLRRRITAVLDRRGRVRDDATPELAALGARSRKLRQGLYDELQGRLSAYKEHLSEDTIPLREGRLVLLLQSGAKGRVQGLVHGRSGSGRSVYFEPLEVVDANNRLQEALDEVDALRRRILVELIAEVQEALPLVEAHADLLAELDVLQSACRFAGLVSGRLAELGAGHEVRLVGARHPLLVPELADLRQEALGRPGHTGAVVPLDLTLDPERRVLVVTGPNAGGKTVALKTLGLTALATQCGLPVPVEPGTRLPIFDVILAVVGDEQDLLTDRSTFSARLLRLKEAWDVASSSSLVLLDELGSGTDPEEGGALAMALVEGLLARGGLAIVTTHLTRLAAMAMEEEGAACGAMEFDPATGGPTYHLRPGSPGGSEALALARRLGASEAWLGRAEELLGHEHRDLRKLLAEVEQVRRELAEGQVLLERRAAEAERERVALERERVELESERKSLAKKLRRELEEFRAKVRGRLREEAEAIQRKMEAGRRKGLATESVERVFADAPEIEVEETVSDRPAAVGDRVRHTGLGWEGTVDKIRGDAAEVTVHGKRLRCGLGELAVVADAGPARGKVARPAGKVKLERSRGGGAGLEDHGPRELNLIGRRVEPALDELDAFLDRALLDYGDEVRVIHGYGTGRLREAVREHLRLHPAVAGFRAGGDREGGEGATVVTLRGAG